MHWIRASTLKNAPAQPGQVMGCFQAGWVAPIHISNDDGTTVPLSSRPVSENADHPLCGWAFILPWGVSSRIVPETKKL
jgi:hypothetical protein